MIEWLDEVIRTVDQWSVDTLEGGNRTRASENTTNNSVKKFEPIFNRNITSTRLAAHDGNAPDTLSPTPGATPSSSSTISAPRASPEIRKTSGAPPAPTPTPAPQRPAYRERPEMLTPMESKWQKFLHSHNIATVGANKPETRQLVMKGKIFSFLFRFCFPHDISLF
jgi:hypothetical protein